MKAELLYFSRNILIIFQTNDMPVLYRIKNQIFERIFIKKTYIKCCKASCLHGLDDQFSFSIVTEIVGFEYITAEERLKILDVDLASLKKICFSISLNFVCTQLIEIIWANLHSIKTFPLVNAREYQCIQNWKKKLLNEPHKN